MCNCCHDEPRIALSSSSRFGAVLSLPPRATRMDASAMVDGWYSTELIAASTHESSFFYDPIRSDGIMGWNGSRGEWSDL